MKSITKSMLSTYYPDFVLDTGTCACCGRSNVVVTSRLSALDFEQRLTCGLCLDKNVEPEAAAIAVYEAGGRSWSGVHPIVLDAVLVHDPKAGPLAAKVWAVRYDARSKEDAARKKAEAARARRAQLVPVKAALPATRDHDLVDDRSTQVMRGILKKLSSAASLALILITPFMVR